jgi:hypothetical protein
VYTWPILQPIIEVSSRAGIKATIQTVLDVGKDVNVWLIFQPRIEVSQGQV